MQAMTTNGMLAKGLSLLIALGEYPDGVGVSEIAREVGLPISTTHRLLAAMIPSGFVQFDSQNRRYYLGLKVFELSTRVSLVRNISEVALPVLRKLTTLTRESASLAVREGSELVYVAQVEGPNRIQVRGSVGTRGPLYSTSQGKAMLAFLPEEEREDILGQLCLKPRTSNTITDLARLREELGITQKRGYAVADEENEDGIRAIGVPVTGPDGRPTAALSVVAPVFRVSREKLDQFLPPLRDAAREIGLRLP